MKTSFKPIFWGLTAVFIWSALPAFVKVGSTASTLPFLLVCRFFLASTVFIPKISSLTKKFSRIGIQWWCLLSLILGANYYFQGLAMIELPVSWYLIIFCLNPLLSLIFIGIQFDKRLLFSVALSLIGTLAFVQPSEILKMQSFKPFLYITIGMFTWVAYTVLIKKFQKVYSDIETTAITQFVSLAACFSIWCFNGLRLTSLNRSEIISIVLLGISTPIAYFGFNACLRQLPKFSIVSQYLEPVFGIFIGLIFFEESLSLIQFLGASMIIFGTISLEGGLNQNKN